MGIQNSKLTVVSLFLWSLIKKGLLSSMGTDLALHLPLCFNTSGRQKTSKFGVFIKCWIISDKAYFCSELIYLQYIPCCWQGNVEARGSERWSDNSPSVTLGSEFIFWWVHNCLKFAVFGSSDEKLVLQIVVNLPWSSETLYKVPHKVHKKAQNYSLQQLLLCTATTRAGHCCHIIWLHEAPLFLI